MSVSIEAVQAADIPEVLSFALQARDELFPTLSATGIPTIWRSLKPSTLRAAGGF